MSDPPDSEATQYSQAFEKFVKDENDLIGLVAYALYKQAVRETALAGGPKMPKDRLITSTELSAYRGYAERRLQTFADASTQQATPEIKRAAVGEAVGMAKLEIIRELYRRTSFWSVVWASLAAWLITIVVTILVIASIYLPNWPGDLADRIRAGQTPSLQTTPTHP